MFYETAANRHGLAHDPFKALVSPRPIGWISTRSPEGHVNLAPYSFFNAVSDDPMIVMFASAGMKDTARFAIASGEFVANLATADLATAVNVTSAPAPAGASEFAISGLTEERSRIVSAPRVGEAAASLECRVTEHFQPKTLSGGRSSWTMVFGEVVGIHIADRVIREGRVDMGLAKPLARLGYLDYSVADAVFEMHRPRRPDGSDVR